MKTMTRMAVCAFLLLPLLRSAADEPVAAGKGLSQWLADLVSKDVAVRKGAARETAGMGPAAAPRAKEIAGRLLEETDASVSRMLAEAFYRMAPEGEDAVEMLAECLKVPDVEARRTIAEALGRMGVGAKEALPALKEAVEMPGQDTWTLRFALKSYGEIAVAADESDAIPFLVEAAAKYRPHVALTVARFRERAAGSVPAMLEALAGVSSPAVQRIWLLSIGMIGPAAREALPAVRQAVASESPDVRAAAGLALSKLEASESSPSLSP